MAGHGDVAHYVHGAPNTVVYDISSASAHLALTCGHCGVKVNAAVIATTTVSMQVAWARCTACGKGIVINPGSGAAPSPKIGENVEGLPDEVASAYDEARRTAGTVAYTSCELMCRKILMHIAVDKGAAEGKSFVDYVDHLTTTGYITPPMKPWADLIRQHGNASTHRLESTTEERAMNTLAFTTQLLRLVYEMDHRAQQYMPTAGTP